MPEEISCRLQTCLVAIPDVAERRYNNLRLISYGSSLIAAQTLRKISWYQTVVGGPASGSTRNIFPSLPSAITACSARGRL